MPLLPDDDILHHVIGGPQLDPIVRKPILGSSMPDKDKEPTCVWNYDNWQDAWPTSCGNLHWFADGTPEENHYKFCPYCGKRLEVKDE